MAKSITPQEVKTLLATDTSAPLLLDVRRKPTFEAAPDRIAGSSWRDPSEVSAWSAGLPRSGPVIVYCVHGHEVSQSVATQLDELGYQARYLEGGIEGWREAGGQIEPAAL
jgi:Fe-Mn family superoxide dismutase